MSDSVRPHRWQPTRLPHPWDSPGKNTGVGCHFLLQCMKVKSESEVLQLCPTLCNLMDCSLPGSSVHGIFQAKLLEWGAIAFSDLSLIKCLFRNTLWENSEWNCVWSLNVTLNMIKQVLKEMGKKVIFAEIVELQLNDLFNIFKAPATFYPIIFNSYN